MNFVYTDRWQTTKHQHAQFKDGSLILSNQGATDQYSSDGHGAEFHFPKQMLPELALIL